jgi:hypothetical protein
LINPLKGLYRARRIGQLNAQRSRQLAENHDTNQLGLDGKTNRAAVITQVGEGEPIYIIHRECEKSLPRDRRRLPELQNSKAQQNADEIRSQVIPFKADSVDENL